jgi:hypothetical protein
MARTPRSQGAGAVDRAPSYLTGAPKWAPWNHSSASQKRPQAEDVPMSRKRRPSTSRPDYGRSRSASRCRCGAQTLPSPEHDPSVEEALRRGANARDPRAAPPREENARLKRLAPHARTTGSNQTRFASTPTTPAESTPMRRYGAAPQSPASRPLGKRSETRREREAMANFTVSRAYPLAVQKPPAILPAS